MVTLTFSTEDPQAEIRVLVESLTAWLAEQPEQPTRSGNALFEYGPDGSLCVVDVIMDPPPGAD